MRWSRVRIAHDPPSKLLQIKQLALVGDCFFYVKNLLTRDLRDLAFQLPRVIQQFQHDSSDQ